MRFGINVKDSRKNKQYYLYCIEVQVAYSALHLNLIFIRRFFNRATKYILILYQMYIFINFKNLSIVCTNNQPGETFDENIFFIYREYHK